MNNLNWNPKYRQKLRAKFFKWLTRIRNATLMQSDQASLIQQKQTDSAHHQSNLHKGDLRSIDTRTFEPSTYSLLESLSSDDYFYQNNNNTNTTNSPASFGGNTTSDFFIAPHSNNSLFDFAIFDANTTTSTVASIAPSAVMHNNNVELYNMGANKMFSENSTQHLIDLKNISITDLNITADYLNDFLKKLLQLSKPLNESGDEEDHESSACQYYCNGFVKDLFGSYKNVHGYISLVVST